MTDDRKNFFNEDEEDVETPQEAGEKGNEATTEGKDEEFYSKIDKKGTEAKAQNTGEVEEWNDQNEEDMNESENIEEMDKAA